MRRMSAPARELVTRSKSQAENRVDTTTKDISYENEILQSHAPRKSEKFKQITKTQVQAEKELSSHKTPAKSLLGDRKKVSFLILILSFVIKWSIKFIFAYDLITTRNKVRRIR